MSARGIVCVEGESVGGLWLGEFQESEKLDEVNAVVAVVVLGFPEDPARAVGGGTLAQRASVGNFGPARQRVADERFKTALAGVGDSRTASLEFKYRFPPLVGWQLEYAAPHVGRIHGLGNVRGVYFVFRHRGERVQFGYLLRRQFNISILHISIARCASLFSR